MSSIQAPEQTLKVDLDFGIGRRALRSAIILGGRQITVQTFGAISGIILARLLTPADFGLYGILTFLFYFLVGIGDLGLGASLVRQASECTLSEYRAVHLVRQVVDLSVFILVWLIAPIITNSYGMPEEHALLFRLLALAVMINSFQVVPTLKLERALSFDRLAVVEILQTLVYTTTLIGLVYLGYGSLSFALSWIVFSISGAVFAFIAAPWSIAWNPNWTWVKERLSFALPYQASNFINLLRDSVTPVLVGTLAGAAAVGYINWSQMLATYSVLGLIVLHRVYLPLFSKLQHDPLKLGKLIEQVLQATNAAVAPLAILTLVFAKPITILVFGEKWLPALPMFYLFWIGNLFLPSTTPILSALNALGYSRMTFLIGLSWMLASWVLSIPLVYNYGAFGFAVATCIVQLSNIYLFRILERKLNFRLLNAIAMPWILASLLGLMLQILQHFYPPKSLIELFFYGSFGAILYALCVLSLLIGPKMLISFITSSGWIKNTTNTSTIGKH